MKTAILFVTHFYNEDIERLIVKLYKETKDVATLYVGFQADKAQITLPDGILSFPFSIRELNMLGYRSWGCTLMDGNFHFVPLAFYLKYPGYDNYWLMEYDVQFSGDWSKFFSFFKHKDEDFISAHIETVKDNPGWIRWDEIDLFNINLTKHQYLKSFNPICRFSNRALGLLHERCRMGDRGHNEVLLPTLFKYYGLRIADFGGHGKYIYKGLSDLFYTCGSTGNAVTASTHRFRPVHTDESMMIPNMIYHPVK